ncbi:MAG: hypothetical protein M1431_06665 [Candidatus Thermoplasmatota archaeon]|nr:hypothetical protein [Candidatus Thermoplasmatota archaeon]
MTLEEILKDIELRGTRELNSLSEYYDQKIQELKRSQELQIRDLEEKYRKKTEEERRTVERTILSSAEMESLKIIRTKESSLIQEALGKAMVYLRELSNKPVYKSLVLKMAQVARKNLGEDCVILAGDKEAEILKTEPGLKVKKAKADPYGGIVAQSSDGSRELDLTLSSLFREVHEKLIAKISEHLGE